MSVRISISTALPHVSNGTSELKVEANTVRANSQAQEKERRCLREIGRSYLRGGDAGAS